MVEKLKPCPFLYDPEDEHVVRAHKWYLSKKKDGSKYVMRTVWLEGKPKVEYFHRLIMNTPVGMDTDHINGNTLDNRKSNLQILTHQQNLIKAKHQVGKSGRRGVWRSTKNTWTAFIKRSGKRTYLGSFDNVEDAHNAWKEAADAWNRRTT